MRRGEIWETDLRSVRQVVIVGVMPNHPNVLVIPLRDDLAVTPTLLAIRETGTGAIADVASMTGISKTRFVQQAGQVDQKVMEEIQTAVRALLDL